ncbi:GtrA family protein [Archangium violaceum]|uniref:GtrA/DPMS transmembrane domain-containing protein n=1 Tax=Archangium violaceum Cb vi76 TaxID=1406225 RepID=A0A084SK29_9BACT|nr:GtrA family protein [Archangium violaceum]KFA88814.1 hypothetical protein Q664_38550 [Archangium violaceum Cb vi76]
MARLSQKTWLQLLAFMGVGGVQLVVDAAVFHVLVQWGAPTVPANFTGRLVGACMGFALNATLTFRSAMRGSMSWQAWKRFWVFWFAMTVLSSVLVRSGQALLPDDPRASGWLTAVKLGVEATLAALSFIISRQWVFQHVP